MYIRVMVRDRDRILYRVVRLDMIQECILVTTAKKGAIDSTQLPYLGGKDSNKECSILVRHNDNNNNNNMEIGINNLSIPGDIDTCLQY